jgi:hypothetical protein
MRPRPSSLSGALGLAALAAAACGGVSLADNRNGGPGAMSGDDGGTIDTTEGGGGSTTCGAAVTCGVSGATYQACTETSASGACAALVYEVSNGKSFTCDGCSSCQPTQQALSAYCSSNPVPHDGGTLEASTEGGADTGVDASDGDAHPDASAPDASGEGGHEAGVDASDGGTRPDGSTPDAGAEGGVEAGACTPGSTQCAGSEIELCGSNGQWGAAEADPIWAVESSARAPDGGITVMNYDGDNGGPAPTTTGVAPDGMTVTFEVWAAPGVSTLSVSYWLNADFSNIQSVPLAITGVTGAGLDRWSGTLPAQSSGTTVTWWAQGTDVCHTGTDYYSNAGNNYVYQTP